MPETTIDFNNFLPLVSKAYHPYLFNRSRYLILYGGAGSGKSYFAADKLILRTLLDPNHRLFAVRKVERSVRNSCFALIRARLQTFGLIDQFIINQKEMRFTCKINGNTIQCIGLDDPEKLKSIYDPTGFWLEEATEFASKDIREINRRLRGKFLKNYKQIILTFNPISSLHPIRARFFTSSRSATERAAGTLVIFKSTWRDNEFLDQEYIDELLAETDPTERQVYTEGEWGILRNVIFGPPEIIDSEPKGLKDRIYGLDFGFTAPSALMEYRFDYFGRKTAYEFLPVVAELESHVKQPSGIIVYEREIIYEKGLTTEALIVKMQLLNVDEECPIYCDSADPGDIKEIYDAGFNAKPCWKAQGSVNSSIRFVKGLTIFGYPGNVNANREAETYRWQTDRNGELVYPEKELDRDNHAMKARMYALMTHLNYGGWCEAFDPRAIGVG